ncbi:MAG: S8/S53 family peptidase [Herminiimonas sp.]|nr:S8/S53 family peptidase [Herminiimonas sp.]
MTNKIPTVPLAGSERRVVANARKLGQAAPEPTLQVTVLARRRTGAESVSTLATTLGNSAPAARVHLDPAEFAARFGADPADLARIEAFAHTHGIDVVDVKPAERRVLLNGSVGAFSAAFGVRLDDYVDPTGDHSFRGRSGPVHLPADLIDVVEGVFGLDNRPQARTHFRVQPPPPVDPAQSIIAHVANLSYTPPQLAAAYDFPTAGSGHGQCVAIIELGGGYRVSDLHAYFDRLGIAPPVIKSRSVDGARNRPTGDSNSADGEVLLDVEVIGAIAPGATIVVYFAPNTDAGFLNALSSAIHDPVNRPSVVSVSWGGPESSWTGQAMRAMDAVFQDAAALGVTICCAAGDDGSSDQRGLKAENGVLHVDFPASSPFSLACGGTRLESAGTPRSETVWNQGRSGGATGGGVSEVFVQPVWQQAAGVPLSGNPGHQVGRGVPDVAGNADPATGYLIQVDGQQMIIGGTSAVAPLYAALIALCNEQLGRRTGYLNPLLYGLTPEAGAFRDIRSGDNDISGRHGAYPAKAGWDACTGLGSVHGTRLLAALKAG